MASILQIDDLIILLKIFAFNNKKPYLYICTMPIGILIIMGISSTTFFTADELSARIEAYFTYVEGEFHVEKKHDKEPKGETGAKKKMWDREPEPPTITGLALFLGFNSRQAFDDYEENGKFAANLKHGRLRIETIYEKKLHQQSPTGAIFALKSMGWNDKTEGKTGGTDVLKSLKIEIIETGPRPANSEKAVVL